MNTNPHELEGGVFGRAVPMAQLPVVKQAAFTVEEHRRLEAIRRELFFKAVVKCLSWAVCVTLWIVLVLVARVEFGLM